MTPRTLQRLFIGLLSLALVLRIVSFVLEPELHSDEIFQYVDPAVHHLRGVGWQTWEWRDGIRSWALPAYHGGWLVVAGWLGVPAGLAQYEFLKLHWAVVSLLWVLLGWSGARSLSLLLVAKGLQPPKEGSAVWGWEAAVLGGLAAAIYPPLIPFAGRTLSEVPSSLLLVAALVVVAKVVREPTESLGWVSFAGGLASTAVCLRVPNGPVALVPVLWLATQRRWKGVGVICLAALVPIVLFGLLDWLTWGKAFSSYVAYVRFNFIEGRAAEFGVEPPVWYLQKLWERGGAGVVALFLIACTGWRATWPFVLSAVVLVVSLSTQAHKEERFILFVWPALLVPAAAVAGSWLRARRDEERQLLWRVALVGLALVAADGLGGVAKLKWNTYGARIKQAQSFISDRNDLTGVLIEESFESASYAGFAQNTPMVAFDVARLGNPLFNYVIAVSEDTEGQAAHAGFQTLKRWGSVVAMQRHLPPQPRR